MCLSKYAAPKLLQILNSMVSKSNLIVISSKISSPISTFSKFKPSSPIPGTESSSKSSKDALVKFLRGHLKPYFTPIDLLRVLKKIHFHPHYNNFILEVFRWATNREGFRHDHNTYEWIISNLASRYRFQEMQKILDEMAVSPCPCSSEGIFCCPRLEHIYICVISSYIRVSSIDEGLNAFEKMKKFIDGKPPVIVYNIILDGFVKTGRMGDAKEFYEGMIRAMISPDVYTLNILLNGLCRIGDLEGALRVLRVNEGKANVVSYNTLIRGLCRAKRVKEGIDLCLEMVGLGVLPSIATFEILFDGLIEEGRAQDTVGLINLLLTKEVCPNSEGFDYFNLVEALCRIGEVGSALEVVSGMWEKGYPPSVVASATLLDGLCKSGMVEETLAVLGKMLECGILPDVITWNLVLEALCNEGRVHEAEKLRLLAVSRGWVCDDVTYNVLLDGFCKQGRVKEGVSLLDEMLDKGFIHDLGMYNMQMDRLKKWKKVVGHNHFSTV